MKNPFGNKKLFIPNCKPLNNTKDGNVVEWECNPQIKDAESGNVLQEAEGVRIMKEDGRKPFITSSGSASTQMADNLIKYMGKRMID